MTAHQARVGYEIEQIIPQVTAGCGIVNSRVALNASKTALRYFTECDKYSFVHDVKEFGPGVILNIGVFSPLEYNPANTIVGNKKEMRHGTSFLTAVRELVKFSGCLVDEVDYAYVMVVPDGVSVDFHKDKYDGARSTLQLAGQREIDFLHSGNMVATTDLLLLPTDAYKMTFTKDEHSISHAVGYAGAVSNNLSTDNLNIGIYINH